jgi:hypothetical protein
MFRHKATQTSTYSNRLHASYIKLTFQCLPTALDARREQLFQRLVLHHLLHHNMYTLSDWSDIEAQQICIYNFMQSYAKQLWPGTKAERLHLANPNMNSRLTRSFVGAIDGHWSARRNGIGKTNRISRPDAEGSEDDETQPMAYGQHSQVGNMWFSKVGKALTKYVDVLLEPSLTNANVEDEDELVKAIVSTEMGPEIPARVMPEVMVMVEDDSE